MRKKKLQTGAVQSRIGEEVGGGNPKGEPNPTKKNREKKKQMGGRGDGTSA